MARVYAITKRWAVQLPPFGVVMKKAAVNVQVHISCEHMSQWIEVGLLGGTRIDT